MKTSDCDGNGKGRADEIHDNGDNGTSGDLGKLCGS